MKKFYLLITLWLYSVVVFADDISGIPDSINKSSSVGQNILKLVAKWGGVGVLVAAGLLLGYGKLKGEAIGAMFYVLLGLGIVGAAFTWWNTQFTAGFAF